MNWKLLAAVLPTIALAACAGPGPGLTGNDTGGIITWSPEHQQVAREWAAEHCARYNKHARITSMNARYGEYIGFTCRFDPRASRP
ncbi:MAG: hypothetical protein ACRECA_04430 [Pseudolabrys sp.]